MALWIPVAQVKVRCWAGSAQGLQGSTFSQRTCSCLSPMDLFMKFSHPSLCWSAGVCSCTQSVGTLQQRSSSLHIVTASLSPAT